MKKNTSIVKGKNRNVVLAKAMKKVKSLIFSGEDKPIKFPTLTKCIICDGICETKELSTEEAFLVAALQHGFYLAKWEGQNVANSDFFPFPCICKCKHVFNERTVGRCLHRWTCEKCEVSLVVDSSD